MKKIETRCKVRRGSVSTLLKLLFISSILLFVSMNNATVMGEGFFIVDEVNSSLLKEGERGRVLCEQNGFLYLYVTNSSQTEEFADCVQIVDFRQPENPTIVGCYEINDNEYLVDFKINDNIAYLLRQNGYSGGINWTVTLLNITNPANPEVLGSSAVETATSYKVDLSSWYLINHKNYTYVSTDFELIIFDCSNPTLPVKVANYTSTGGELHVNNDFLYLVSAGVKIYSLADPVNLLFLGEVNSTKHTIAGSGVYGNYVINTFWWSGIQIYNCTDPVHPTICWNYDFSGWEYYYRGEIHDMGIIGDRLFAGGNRLHIFDISDLQNVKRIARINFGDRALSRLTVSEEFIFLTILSNIIVYSYIENFRVRNVGIGIGVGLPVVVGASLFIRWKKKRG